MSELQANESNPYIGPRSFRAGERIYGRQRESNQLTNLIVAERIVLMHSPSGAGKTSLIQAAVVPRLEKMKFIVLPVVRVNLDSATAAQQGPQSNRYVFSALLSLEEGLSEGERLPADKLADMSLAAYLDQRVGEQGDDRIEVLIFDQFEEILTQDPTDLDAKTEFFRQVGEALQAPNRWALFSMRDDFVAALDPYLVWIPNRLSANFRLDLLGIQAAMEAIQGPAAAAGVEFEDAAAEKLVDDLRLVRVQQPDGSTAPQPGPYVEPVQLQVVCYRLWSDPRPNPGKITPNELEQFGEVDQSLVDSSLAEYYAQRVEAAAEKTGVPERSIREWVDRQLISEQGVRGTVLMGVDSSGELPNQAIWFLVNAYLVRAEKRGGATWFELSHDRLITPVRENNRRWFDQNLNALQQRSGLWKQQGKPDSLLLRDAELNQAETWVQGHPSELNQVDQEFYKACLEIRQRDEDERKRQAQAIKLQEQQKVAKVLKRLLTFAVVAAIVAGIFGVVALVASIRATSESQANSTLAVEKDQNARTAEAASTLAVGNASTAQANANMAKMAEATARSDRAAAVAAEATAHVAEATAVYNAQMAIEKEGEARVSAQQAMQQAGLANSRRLASLAQGFIDTQADLTSLLGIEALNITQTYEAKNVLLARLQRSLELNIEEYWRSPTGRSDINSVAFSPVGKQLAYGSTDGVVVIVNYESLQIEKTLRTALNIASKVDTVTFSPDGKMVAAGGPGNHIIIWNVETGEEVYQLQNNLRIYSLSFNPKNANQLVAGAGNSLVFWDLATQQKTTMYRFGNYVYSVAWSPDGSRIAAGSADRFVRIWRSNSLTNPIQDYRLHKNKIWSVAWSPDSKILASTGEDSTIIFWNVDRATEIGEPIRAFHGYGGYSVAFSSDGKILASGGADGNLAFWDVNTQTLLAEHKHHNDAVVSVAFSPVGGGFIVASSSIDNTVLLHRLTAAQSLSEPIPSPARGQILSLVNLPGNKNLVAEKNGSLVRIWDLSQDSNQPAASLPAPKVSSGAFSPDGSLVALGGSDGVIQVFDWVNENVSATLTDDSQEILALTFSPDGQKLISVQCEEVLSADDSEKMDHVPCIRHQLLFWDLESGQIATRTSLDQSNGVGDYIHSLAIDRNGKLLAIGSEDGSIMVWDIPGSQPDGVPLDQHTASVTSLAFSPDGATLASGSEDMALILWDVDSHQSIAGPISGAASNLTALAYSPEDHLASGDSSGRLLSWYADARSWVERNCMMTGRNLTLVEWRQYVSQSEKPYRATCKQFPLETPEPVTGLAASTPTPSP